MTAEERSKFLEDAFYQLSLSGEKPDVEVLDKLVQQHPEYADILTAFAIDLALDPEVIDDSEGSVDSKHEIAMSRAISRFHNRVYALKQPGPTVHSVDSSAANPFSALNRDRFRDLAKRLNINTVFLQKVRDRVIEDSTIPNGFRERLGRELGIPLDELNAHLRAPAHISPAYYKADQKPEAGPKQTFEQAVKTSGLTADQQVGLLGL